MSLFQKIRALSCFAFIALVSTDLEAKQNVAFHFCGAEDCFPCVAFKTRHLEGVLEKAEKSGFQVNANMIDRTVDIRKVGIYGEADPLLRLAGDQLRRMYPPVFFITKDEKVVSVHGGDWREALEAAVRKTQ